LPRLFKEQILLRICDVLLKGRSGTVRPRRPGTRALLRVLGHGGWPLWPALATRRADSLLRLAVSAGYGRDRGGNDAPGRYKRRGPACWPFKVMDHAKDPGPSY